LNFKEKKTPEKNSAKHSQKKFPPQRNNCDALAAKKEDRKRAAQKTKKQERRITKKMTESAPLQLDKTQRKEKKIQLAETAPSSF